MKSGPRSFKFQVTAIGLALVLAFTGIAYLYQQQDALLASASRYRPGYLPWYSFQIEKEAMRLHEALHALRDTEGAAAATDKLAEVQLRFEVLASRVQVLDDARDRHALEQSPYKDRRKDTGDAMHLFIAEADRLLAAGPGRQDLDTLIQRLEDLAPTLHAESQAAHQNLTRVGEETFRQISRHNRYGAMLTILLSLLVLGLGVLALRHISQLAARRSLEQMAEELREARVAADAANRAKSVFVANMSHELRTPFQGMLGMMALMKDTPLTPEQADYLGTAQDSARHLLQILNDVLDISKLEAGTLAVRPAPTAIRVVFSEVEALMRPLAADHRLPLRLSIDPALPEWLLMDATRFKQILFNLISNAIKFTPDGHVDVRARWTPASSPQDPDGAGRLGVDVVDTGVGISASALPELFTRFHPRSDPTSRRFGGSGLGLDISRTLARRMGGDVTASSAVGLGSTFTLDLPLTPCEAPVRTPRPLTPLANRPEAQRLRVLVAEDHPVNRKYMAATLSKLGVRVDLCENGFEAVRSVSATPYDVVFMDVHMPGMDGLEASRAIRRLEGAAGATRIVALTADAQEETRERALAAGMDAFITKPASLADLTDALHLPGTTDDARGDALDRPGSGPTWAHSSEIRFAAEAGVVDLPVLEGVARMLSAQRYIELAESLFRDESGVLRQLKAAVHRGDAHAVDRLAHSFKGAAEIVGLTGVAEAAARFGSGAAPENAVDALAALERTIDTARIVVRTMLADALEEEEP